MFLGRLWHCCINAFDGFFTLGESLVFKYDGNDDLVGVESRECALEKSGIGRALKTPVFNE